MRYVAWTFGLCTVASASIALAGTIGFGLASGTGHDLTIDEIADAVHAHRDAMGGLLVDVKLERTSGGDSIWETIDESLVIETGSLRHQFDIRRTWQGGQVNRTLNAFDGQVALVADFRDSGDVAVTSVDLDDPALRMVVGASEYLRLLRFDPWGHTGLGGDLAVLLASPATSLRDEIAFVDGFRCAVIDVGDAVSGQIVHTIALAIDYSFLPVEQVLWRGDGEPLRVATVTEVVEALPNVWMPTRAVIEYPQAITGAGSDSFVWDLSVGSVGPGDAGSIVAGHVPAIFDLLDMDPYDLLPPNTMVRPADGGPSWFTVEAGDRIPANDAEPLALAGADSTRGRSVALAATCLAFALVVPMWRRFGRRAIVR